jgi:hypothetical protein
MGAVVHFDLTIKQGGLDSTFCHGYFISINAAFKQFPNLGEAAWFAGFPPSRIPPPRLFINF